MTSLWDAGGRRTRLTAPAGYWVGYSHLDTGEVSALLMSNNAPLATFHYDGLGRRDYQYLLNGVSATFARDPLDRLTQFAVIVAPPNNFTLDFTRNAASGIAANTRSNDAYAWSGHYALTRSYTTDGLNRYSAISSISPAPTYDGNGNLTSAGGATYTYDVENRLVGASGASSVTLTYDPLGRLSQIATAGGATRRFGYDGDALIDEFDGAGSVRRVYVHGPNVDEPMFWWDIPAATWGTLQADERGSIVAVANSSGAAATINRYDEYGIPATTNAGAFQYTGQVWLPELGMYHYKARIYSPTLGRFMQTDPVGYDDQFNLYAYVGNDPVNRTDPTGTHGRGSGWDDSKWRRYNNAQRAEARQMERTANRINRALERGGGSLRSEVGKFERVFGSGTGTEANLRAAASLITTMAEALRDDGSNGYWANAKPASEFSSPSSFARGEIGGRNIDVNVAHPSFSNSGRLGWAVGHEVGHNAGLTHAEQNGVAAYRYGDASERSVYESLRQTNPNAAMRNPDHIMEYIRGQ